MAPNAAFVSALLLGLGSQAFAQDELTEFQKGTLSLVHKYDEEGNCFFPFGSLDNLNCQRMTSARCNGDKQQQWAYNPEGYVYSPTIEGGFQDPNNPNGFTSEGCGALTPAGEEGGCLMIFQRLQYDYAVGGSFAVAQCNATDPRANWKFTDLGQILVVEPEENVAPGAKPNNLCLAISDEPGRAGFRDINFQICETADPKTITWQFDPPVTEGLVPGIPMTGMPADSGTPAVDGGDMGGDVEVEDTPMGNETMPEPVGNATDIDEDLVATEKAGGERERVLRGKVLDTINKIE